MRKIKIAILGIMCIIIVGLLMPQNLQMPVAGAHSGSYNHQTFWYYPWGSSIVHKGVDIFAKKGTSIKSSTVGVVLLTGSGNKSGNYIVVLGPKWRLHYYAHLDEVRTSVLSFVGHDTEIGTVGNTGNAKTTPSHLHYGIATLFPYPWRMDDSPLGWQKMFYLNPIDYLKRTNTNMNNKAYTNDCFLFALKH